MMSLLSLLVNINEGSYLILKIKMMHENVHCGYERDIQMSSKNHKEIGHLCPLKPPNPSKSTYQYLYIVVFLCHHFVFVAHIVFAQICGSNILTVYVLFGLFIMLTTSSQSRPTSRSIT